MDTVEALTLIIARCPAAVGEATAALRAVRADTAAAERRLARAVRRALARCDTAFTPAERAALRALVPPPAAAVPRLRDLRLRVNEEEKRLVQARADAAGLTLSDYLRRLLGLPPAAPPPAPTRPPQGPR